MTLRQHRVAKRHVHSPCSIPSRVATLSHHLPADGKRLQFDIWKSFNEVTAVLSTLSTNSWSFNDDFMCILETYVVLLYNRTCTETTVVSARKHILDFMCILETYVVLLYTRTCTETTVDSARKHILCSKAGQSKPYHPQEQYCFNTRNGLYTKVDKCGDKHVSVLQNFLRQRPAGGDRVPRKLGSRCGHCFQEQWHRVQNCYAAGGRKREEVCASVSELL